MTVNRREFLDAGLGLSASMLVGASRSPTSPARRFKAVAFDAFPIFDPRPITTLAEVLFPGKGEALAGAWRIRQFEYAWLGAIMGRYRDFMRATDDALVFTARSMKLDLTPEKRDALLGAYLRLGAWPDARPALKALKAAGLQLAFLSNFTPAMLAGCIATAGIDSLFDEAISTDEARTFKPDPRAYQIGVDRLRLRRQDILFVAFAGWDAAGAKSFGYPTFWTNRLGLPPEELGATADGTGNGLPDLLAFLNA